MTFKRKSKLFTHYHEYPIMNMYIICNNIFVIIIIRNMFVLIEHDQNGMKNIGIFYVPFCLLWCYYTRTLMLRKTRCPNYYSCKTIAIECLRKAAKHYNKCILCQSYPINKCMYNGIYYSKIHYATTIENIETDNFSWTNNIYCMTITFGS